METPAGKTSYPSDLNETEWAILDPLIPRARQTGRPEKYPKREILNAIFYLVRSGCAWRMLPNDLPPWRLVWHYFSHWKKQGVWARLNDTLRDAVRLHAGKQKPTAAILDAQSVRTTESGGVRGYDAGKKVAGRKRHLLVDTLGLILLAKVHPADVQDRDGARLLLAVLATRFGWLRCIWADGGSAGALVAWVRALRPGRGNPAGDRPARHQTHSLQNPSPPLGRRTHFRLARALPPAQQGL